MHVCTVPCALTVKYRQSEETTNKHTVWKVISILDLKSVRLGANIVDISTVVWRTSVWEGYSCKADTLLFSEVNEEKRLLINLKNNKKIRVKFLWIQITPKKRIKGTSYIPNILYKTVLFSYQRLYKQTIYMLAFGNYSSGQVREACNIHIWDLISVSNWTWLGSWRHFVSSPESFWNRWRHPR